MPEDDFSDRLPENNLNPTVQTGNLNQLTFHYSSGLLYRPQPMETPSHVN